MYARCLVLALACSAACARAQDGSGRLNLQHIITEALENSPEVLAAQKRYEAVAQKPRAESALPDPMVSLGYNSTTYPLPGFGLGREPVANIGFMYSQEFPYPGKRGLRMKLASKEAEAEWQNYQATELALVANVKQGYFRLQHTYSMLDLVSRNRQVLRRMLSVAETRYSSGKGMQQDIFRTQTQLSLLEIKRIQLERELRAAEVQLRALLNRPAASAITRPPDAVAHEALPPVESIIEYAEENAPMLARDLRMIQRSEIALAAARKDYYPDFTLNGGYYNMGSMPPMWMFRADVKLPLWSKKNRAAVTEQSYNIAAARRGYQSSRNNLEAEIRDEYLKAESARQLMDIYTTTIIPQANLALESSLAGYQAGQGEFMGVLQNFMTSVEYEMNYHEEMQNFHAALARIEEKSAMPLTHMEAE